MQINKEKSSDAERLSLLVGLFIIILPTLICRSKHEDTFL